MAQWFATNTLLEETGKLRRNATEHENPIYPEVKEATQVNSKYICSTSVTIHLLKARESCSNTHFREEMCWRLRQVGGMFLIFAWE